MTAMERSALVLKRKLGESVIIQISENVQIEIVLLRIISAKVASIAFIGPKSFSILRKEILDRVRK